MDFLCKIINIMAKQLEEFSVYILDPSENLTKVIILRERAVFQALSILISKLLEDKNKQVFKIILDRQEADKIV